MGIINFIKDYKMLTIAQNAILDRLWQSKI